VGLVPPHPDRALRDPTSPQRGEVKNVRTLRFAHPTVSR
jgi:hypothetical protein